AASAAAGEVAGECALARQAPLRYPRQHVATRYRLWGACAGGRALLPRRPRPRKWRRSSARPPVLLPARLLDVVECRETRAASGIHDSDLVSRGNGGLVGGTVSLR